MKTLAFIIFLSGLIHLEAAQGDIFVSSLPQTNNAASSNFLFVVIPSLGTNDAQLISVANLFSNVDRIITSNTNSANVLGGIIQRQPGGTTRGFMATDLQYGPASGAAFAPYSFLGGGQQNQIQVTAINSAIPGGFQNNVSSGNSAILCGRVHEVSSGMSNSWIGGGVGNFVHSTGQPSTAMGSSWVGGGNNCEVDVGLNCVIAGGQDNLIGDQFEGILTTNSFIGAGKANTIQASLAAILGGSGNIINAGADNSHAIGNNLNVLGSKQVALGNGAGPYVLIDDTNVTLTSTMMLTHPQDSYTYATISGAGNGSTNYTLFGNRRKMYLGSSNVNIVAVMETFTNQVRFCSVSITNLSAITWGIGFSSVTNRWRFYNPAYGTNAPVALTNNTELVLDLESQGTNILASYRYFNPGL